MSWISSGADVRGAIPTAGWSDSTGAVVECADDQTDVSVGAWRAFAYAVAVVYGAVLLWYVPLGLMGAERPIFNLDYPVHFHNAANAYDSFRAMGKLVGGYVPYFMAGHPFLEPTSSRLMELTAVLFGDLGLVGVFNATVWAMVMAGPIFIACVAAHIAPNRGTTAILLALMLGYFMLKLMYLVAVGLISYELCMVACLLLVVRFNDLCGRFSVGEFALVAGLGVFCLLLHASAGLMMLVPCVAIVMGHAMRGRFFPLLLGALIGAVALGGNAYWWFPVLVEHRALLEPLQFNPFGDMRDYATQAVAVAVLMSAIFGARVWRQVRPEGPLKPLYLGGVALLLASVFGEHVPILSQSQPGRYRTAGILFLLPHMGVLVSQGVAWFGGRTGRMQLTVATLMCAAGLGALPLRGQSRLRTIDPERQIEALCDHIGAYTDRSGRILMEEAANVAQPGVEVGLPLGSFATGYVARATDREMIGGPNQTTFLKHHYASFNGGLLFRRPIGEYCEAELGDLFETFNIRWVYCWSTAAVGALRGAGSLAEPIGSAGGYEAFRVLRRNRAGAGDGGFVLDGVGCVEASAGRIRVTGAGQPVTILKYHWHEGLKADPVLPISGHAVEGARLDFIQVLNGTVRDFVIHQ